MGKWQPIETAPNAHDWMKYHGLHSFIVAQFGQRTDEDGGDGGEPEMVWAQVVYLSSSGWMLNSHGFAGVHGNASFPIANGSHWMVLDQSLRQAQGETQ